MFCLYKFKSRGVGVVSTIDIPKNTFVGNYLSKEEVISSESRFIWDGWIETNPLGRYLNHNIKSNLFFVKNNKCIELYSKEIIKKNTELTVDYTQIVKMIDMPESLILTYEIYNYDYIEEEIIINKNII